MDQDWSWGAGWRGRWRLGPDVCDPRVAGGSAEQQGKWEHLCRSVAAPSSLTNFEIDLRPPFPRCTGAQAEKQGLLSSSF
ncbi:hypothetical protein CesoFtcFv8_027877 [Champsocephalus esox]|uniref:Uncharacterized protein n=1 Tax=Champsocephalus esox TaxID=159716 RepID=A0AAN8AZ82_9TELE|nr:hypothetical protein CesoFtcFv8_027877 [Champsocephalus esox]